MEDDDGAWDEDFVDDGIDLMNRPSMTNLITAGSFAHLHVTSNISQHSAATPASHSNTTYGNHNNRPILAQYYLRQESENVGNDINDEKDMMDEIPNIGLDGLELEDHINDSNTPLNLKMLERPHSDTYHSRLNHVAENDFFDDNDDNFSRFDGDGGEIQSDRNDDEEEEDWDKDLDLQLPPTKKPEASQRAVALSGIRGGTTQSSESLLEFLESSVRERMSRNANHDEAFIPPESDDVKKHDLQNQRLKGLTEWLKSTSRALHSTINRSNSSGDCNARVMMERERQRTHADVSFIEQIVEKCEEEPTKESCIISLEIVVKWIRGVCHGLDRVSENDAFAFSSSGQKPLSPSVCDIISNDKLDQLFIRCDYILNEQSKSSVARILEYVKILREEQILLRFPDVHNYTGKRGSVIPAFLKLLCYQFRLCRIQLYMMEIKAHVNTSDNLISHLENLENIMEELETLAEWLESLALFLPPADFSVSNIGIRSNFKYDEEMKIMVIEKTKVALNNRLTHSFYNHPYRLHHAEALRALLIELQAICLSNKMLLLANLSPISMQLRKTHKVEHHHRPVRALFRNATRNNRSLIQESSFHGGGSNFLRSKSEESTIYNVVYETNIGGLFVALMVSLESPSIVRSRLAFAACCYIQALQKDQLPWQSGKYSKVIREKRDNDGFVALRRSCSEVTFGVEEVDIQYNGNEFSVSEFEKSIVETFSQSLGPIDELKNLQVLLFEGAVDLFPTLQKLEENFHTLSYRSSVLFPHVTASMDLELAFEEKILKNGSPIVTSSSSVSGSVPTIHNITIANVAALSAGSLSPPPHSTMGVFTANSNDGGSSYHSSSRHSNSIDMQSALSGATFSSLLKYELYLYSFALLSQFVNSISDSYPSIAVELLEFCTLILVHLDNTKEQRKYHKQALLLAIRCGDCEAAIKHGHILWEQLFNSFNCGKTNLNVSELIYVAELLGDQFAVNAQYELAIKVYGTAIHKCCEIIRGDYKQNHMGNSFKRKELSRFNKHYESKLEGLLLSLGRAYLDFGSTYHAIKVFKRVLMDCTEKRESMHNDEKKIIFLSWILKAFYDLRDFDSCKRTIDVMKEVRKRNIHKLLDHLSSLGFEKALGDTTVGTFNAGVNGERLENNYRTSEGRHQKSGGIMSQRYLMNTIRSSLPQFVINAHNIDLGVMLSKICCKTGQFVSALHTLTPAIICAEMLVGGKAGTKEGMLELGNLYYLRGKIELEACRSAQPITYPFEIGSNQLFAAVQLLCADFVSSTSFNRTNRTFYKKDSTKVRESGIKAANRRSHASSVGYDGAEGICNKIPNQLHVFTCRKTAVYNDAADLLWDAMKWFRRAWDLFHAAGDEISAARSANRIAECHLLPSFVPHAFFGVPLDMALDLSNYKGGDPKYSSTAGAVNSPDKISPHPPKGKLFSSAHGLVDVSSPVGHSNIIKRFASLEEVERVTSFAYDLHLDASLPIELMESFMNLAEMHSLQGHANALPFWWEAKDLFLYFFSDGTLVPIIRRCPQGFVEKLSGILDRIVRYLWKCEETVRNDHLILLEIHNTFKVEQFRARRCNIERSRAVAQRLLSVYRALIKRSKGSPSKPPSKGGTLKHHPIAPKKTGTHKRKKSFFAHLCWCGSSSQNIEDAVDPKHPTEVHEIPPASRTTPKSPNIVRSFNENSCLGKESLELILELSPMFEKSDRSFAWMLNDEVVLDKHMDFGWNDFVDYSALIPLTTANIQSKRSTAGSSFYRPQGDYIPTADKSISSHTPSEGQEKLFTSILEAAEYYCSRHWIFKYYKIPSFLLNHAVNERDLMPIDDPDRSDSDEDSISNPSSFTSGSKLYSVSSRPTGDDNSSAQPFYLGDPNRPLDPFADFDWMDESFACHYVPHLLDETEDPKPSYIFLPELSDLVITSILEKSHPNLNHDDVKALVMDSQFHHILADKSEKVLIQRVWSLFTKARNSCSLYRDQKMNLMGLKRQVRLSLSGIAMNMLRLRTFSRQFKSSIYCYSLMTSMLLNNSDFFQESKNSSLSSKSAEKFRAMKLQERLPQTVYVHYIDKVLFTYNPYSGSEHIQMLGANSCLKFSNALNVAITKSEVKESWCKDGDDTTSNDTSNSLYSLGLQSNEHFGFEVPPQSPPPLPNFLRLGENSGIATSLGDRLYFLKQETSFSLKETSMMFALCTKESDQECAGGAMGRFNMATLMKNGALSGTIAFLKTFSPQISGHSTESESIYGNMPVDKSKVGNVSSNNKSVVKSLYFQGQGLPSGNGKGKAQFDDRISNFNDNLALRIRNQVDGENNARITPNQTKLTNNSSAPLFPVPLTIFCSYPTNIIPWELLLEECSVVRAFGLASLLSQVLDRRCLRESDEGVNSAKKNASASKPSNRSTTISPKSVAIKVAHFPVRGYIGPGLNQKPVFVTIGYDVKHLGEMSERQLRQRKAKASLHIIDNLDHNCNHIIRDELSLKPAPQEKNGWRNDQNEIVQVVRNTAFPLPSKSFENVAVLENASILQLQISSNAKSTDVSSFWSQVDSQIDSSKRNLASDQLIPSSDDFFPIILFTYCDLMELSDSVIAVTCMLRRNSIFIFVPYFIQDKLLTELKIGMDRWCRTERSDVLYDSPKNLLLMNSGNSSSGSAFGSGSSDQFISLTHASNSSTYLPRGPSNLNINNSQEGSSANRKNITKGIHVPNASSTSSHDMNEMLITKSIDSDVFPMLQNNMAADQDQSNFISRTCAKKDNSQSKLGVSSDPLQSRTGKPPLAADIAAGNNEKGLKTKDRTWAYHIVMDVVHKLQRDHALPIPVIM